ncbi:S8 family peptidase [Clostridium sp. FP1]|uniref:S8 family peptidase n=1 Tax=Clostridium sp. FP1 TaxID=2724076 RepID=UPI0013E953F5|nr:S8 family serine peptidase [Clostridium sp. FP1]MBZ9635020.1 S8 family serine peptidase [Clostridium sp. FP1]
MKKKYLIATVIFIAIPLFSYNKVNVVNAQESTTAITLQEGKLEFPLNTANTTKYTGKGVKIAILDSGIDINHADLKGKIIGGYDFVENKPIYMDGDDRRGHGTHVAGIAAANGEMKGIASEASLLIYRVVTKDKEQHYKNIVEAMKKAVQDGAQVINISSRVDSYTPGDALDIEIKKAKEQGIIVVKSNGNTGPEIWTTSDLACSPDVISVGNATLPSKQPIFKDGNQEVSLKIGNGTIIFPEKGKINYAGKFPEQGKVTYSGKISKENIEKTDLKKKIVIMNTTKQYLNEKDVEMTELVTKLKASGASGLIITGIDSDDNIWSFLFEGLPIAFVKSKDVESFNNIVHSKNPELTNKLYQEIFFESSRGPSKNNMLLKPDISAPGTKILSTTPYLINDIGYINNTGTSMAAPYITGTIALIKQAHSNWGFDEIKAAITNNANILKDEKNKYISLLSQGAGVVNIEKAINSDTFIISDNLSFPLLTKGVKEKTYDIKLKNSSNETKEYNISVEKFSEFKGIDINIPSTINAKSGSLEKVSMNVKINETTPKGIYEGILWFKNNEDEKHVPFIILVNQK